MGRFISRDPLRYVDGFGLYNGYFADRFGQDPLGQKCEKVKIVIPIAQSLGDVIDQHPNEYITPAKEVVWVGTICINCETGLPSNEEAGIEGPKNGKIYYDERTKDGKLKPILVGEFSIAKINITTGEANLKDCPCSSQSVYTITFTVQAVVSYDDSVKNEKVELNAIAGTGTYTLECDCK